MNLVGSSLTLMEEVSMADLSKEEVKALGHAVGLEIKDPELTEVTYSINALLEALDIPPDWRT